MKAEPPAFPHRDDIVVDKGAAAPKSFLSPMEMCTLTAASVLFPTGTAFTAMRIIFPRPLFSWSLGETKKRISRTSIQNALYYSSFWRINNQLASFWRRVIQTKSRQTLVLDPGGYTSCLRSCPFLGTRRALL